MKKNFSIKDEKHKPEQKLNIIKGELKKYFARERRKSMPAGFNTWIFDCKVGVDADSAVDVEEQDLRMRIDKIIELGKTEFYIEIFSRAVKKEQRS